MTVRLLGNRNFLTSQNEVMLGKKVGPKASAWCPFEKATWRPHHRRMSDEGRGVTHLPARKCQGPRPLPGAERDLGHLLPEAEMGTSLCQSALVGFSCCCDKIPDKVDVGG